MASAEGEPTASRPPLPVYAQALCRRVPRERFSGAGAILKLRQRLLIYSAVPAAPNAAIKKLISSSYCEALVALCVFFRPCAVEHGPSPQPPRTQPAAGVLRFGGCFRSVLEKRLFAKRPPSLFCFRIAGISTGT